MRLEKAISYILAGGIVVGGGLMLLGLALSAGSISLRVNTTALTPQEVIQGLERLDGVDAAAAGIMALVAAPVLIAAVNLAYYLKEGDYLYAAFSAIVLLNLLVSIFVLPGLLG